ncbi:MAG: hypothetical protein OEV40_15905 [Acidimicrobiia bacterium]|nr:hypothetical protein [Acidimicrobiia bacterium]
MAGSTNGTEFEISLDAVIVAVTDDAPRLLVVEGPDGLPALPSGLLEPQDPTLELGLRRWVAEQTGLDVGYVEQLYTFGDRARTTSPDGTGGNGEALPGLRRLSIAYLALMREEQPSGMASWRDFYDFVPWEDHRRGRPAVIDDAIMPALERFVAVGTGRREREERVRVAFGPGRSFDGVRVLERCELLYEAGLLQESGPRRAVGEPDPLDSSAMYLDHRRIAATALGRLRGKLTYRPVVFELLPDRFTLRRLQLVVEALAGVGLHTQNFRRLVETGGLVEGTGEQAKTGGRPAELFRFRRDVLGERPAPGVGSPWIRS